MEAIQAWFSGHKLTSIGAFWASAIGASLAYNTRTRSPLKPSLRLIHARMHAQALIVLVLSGAAAYHYYERVAVNKRMSQMPKQIQTILCNKRTLDYYS